MKRIHAVLIAAATVGLLAAPTAEAGINNSRHDMSSGSNPYTTLAAFAEYGACSACHIPHGAQGARLFPKTPEGSAGGFFGPLCQTCHSPSIVPTAPNLNADTTVFNGSHGLSIATLQLGDDDETVATSGLPYTTGNAPSGATNIECLSCHDVHNQNSQRPFLQEDLDILCQDCHSNRVNAATGTSGWANNAGTTGSTHPAGAAYTGDVSGIATAPNSPIFDPTGGELVANVDTGANGSTWTDAVWDSGMQLENQGAYGAAGYSCKACHNPHWDETDATPNNGTAYLGIVDDGVVGAVLPSANLFCEYCHRGSNTGSAGSRYWNPGNTAFSHPNDDVRALDTGLTIDYTWQPASTTSPKRSIAGAGSSTLLCTSCHGVHPNTNGGVSETELNTPILLTYATGDICQACHMGAGAALTFNHHPTGTPTYATLGNNTAANALTCSGGNLAPGVNQCHGAGGGTGANGSWVAHNRSSALGMPPTSSSTTCTNCHSCNPSTYTTTTPYTASGAASHFVCADTDTTTWTNGRTTGAAGTIRTNGGPGGNWTGSGLPSLFGATPTTMICESCHRLANGNLDDGDGSTALLLEVVGSDINMGDVTDNSTPDDPTDDLYTYTRYLCGGCHLVPGGTHPLGNATGSVYAITNGAGQTYTTAGGMNCESCHSAHDAITTSGSYILDGGSAVALGSNANGMAIEPTINYTTFCAVCHTNFQ